MTENERLLCEDWVKAHVASWQVLSRAQWKYVFHPKTLVRFVEESSMREEEVKLILEYLASDDCIATLSLYDQAVVGYKPTKVWYEASNRVQNGVRGVRLHQALSDTNEQDDGPYVVEDGCAWKVEHTFVWGATESPTVEPSTSGVMHKIEALRRDEETGLFSYVKEKRTRVQQNIPEYVRDINAFREIKESSFYGVTADKVEGIGKAASLSDGVLVERKVTKNEDCTSDILNTETTATFVWHKYVWTDNRGKHTRFWYRNSPKSWVGANSSTEKEQESTANENDNTTEEPLFVIPLDVDTVDSHEVINEFNLYDGSVTYSYLNSNNNGSGGDYSGDTTGAPVVLYEDALLKPKNIRYVKKYEIQMTIYRGFNISVYDDSASKANIARTDPGVLRVKSLSQRYRDSEGVVKKDWAQVDLQEVGEWEKYDGKSAHKDIRIVSPDAVLEITKALLDGLGGEQ